MASDTVSQLTPLLPTAPYLLAYALPLLLLSLVLTFAGTFLTLDRTRSFPSSSGVGSTYAPLPIPGGFTKKSTKSLASKWVLEGGVGGLIGGYAFGGAFRLSSSLMIYRSNFILKFRSPFSDGPRIIDPWDDLLVHIVTQCLPCCVASVLNCPHLHRRPLSACHFPVPWRFRRVGLSSCHRTKSDFNFSTSTLTALALCIITHPALRSRIILTAIFLPLFTLLVLIAGIIPRITHTLMHPILRICTASTGSFGVIGAISLLLKPQEHGWANAWERLWISDGEWGSSQERGLSAAWAVFFVAGMAIDWALNRWIGECPDEVRVCLHPP